MTTNKLMGLILMMCVGCVSQSTTPSTNRDVDHVKGKDMSIWTPKTDDINWSVNPGWHDGKDYAITQSLHANKVVKEKNDELAPVQNP